MKELIAELKSMLYNSKNPKMDNSHQINFNDLNRLLTKIIIKYERMKNYKHKWKYNKEDRPLACCYDCRMKYDQFPDMVIPDDLWETISPSCEEGGLLCPTCIANRLSYLGFWYKDGLFQLQRKDAQLNKVKEILKGTL